MVYRELWVLLEGRDDAEFFEAVIKPLLQDRDCKMRLYEYAHKSLDQVTKLLQSIKRMPETGYVLVQDLHEAPCIPAKKQETMNEYTSVVAEERVLIVVKEIESWYLAGVTEEALRKMGVRRKVKSTAVTKEQFNRLIPKGMPRPEFMQRIQEIYDVEAAKKQNSSFEYLVRNLDGWISSGHYP